MPVQEPLLADRPEHRIARPEAERIAADNPHGFRMDVPELLYDRGELHNLSISRGTLTPEDRYKINEHFEVSLEGSNLTNEAQESWVANPALQLPLEYSKTGRQYLLGVRYKF